MGSIYTEDTTSIQKYETDDAVLEPDGAGGTMPFAYNGVYFGIPAKQGPVNEEGQLLAIDRLTWDHVNLPNGTMLWNGTNWIVTEEEPPPIEGGSALA